MKMMSFNTQHCLNFIDNIIDFSIIAKAITDCGADIVGLNEIQCGNPGLYAIDSTNAAMAEYMRTLFSADEAQALGIGNVYEKWW
jgi:endonuclease/exonuclease/phosphatase family metal-dependent hydrolase